MYYCPRCRSEVSVGAHFCVKCGYQQQSRQPQKSQQFLRPGFLPAHKQRLDTQHISEQQTQQTSVHSAKLAPPGDFNEFEDNFESYAATSKAAERWRTSWRKRQRSEAGPATSVSRGQSVVPEPLMAMQHSLARMRAIIVPSGKQNASLGFWITIILMTSLIVGLAAFIVSTYLPNSDTALPGSAPIPTDTPQPGLRMEGPQLATLPQGQMLHLHGENFDIGAPIIFLLDRTTAISGTNGLEIALLTSDEGSFDVAMPTAKWSIGEHLIQARDNKNGQSAYLPIRVSPASVIPTTNPDRTLAGLSLRSIPRSD